MHISGINRYFLLFCLLLVICALRIRRGGWRFGSIRYKADIRVSHGASVWGEVRWSSVPQNALDISGVFFRLPIRVGFAFCRHTVSSHFIARFPPVGADPRRSASAGVDVRPHLRTVLSGTQAKLTRRALKVDNILFLCEKKHHCV